MVELITTGPRDVAPKSSDACDHSRVRKELQHVAWQAGEVIMTLLVDIPIYGHLNLTPTPINVHPRVPATRQVC
jgi:hypothetical protein